ncbi:BTB/POZ domain-containing protein KCTD16 [Aphelenchoides fujianensis]|nr:BTB/POZ domain-containing protein KCTD16 [Aphelenchoides fujianensis]
MPLNEPIVQLRLSEGRMIQTILLFAELLSDEKVSGKQLVRIECSHRDKNLLRFLVDCLRQLRQDPERAGLRPAGGLRRLATRLRQAANELNNTITVSYHGALTSAKAGGATADVNFRRIQRIVVHGLAWVCREVFGQHLNETRDGNVDSNRYTARFFSPINHLEQCLSTIACRCDAFRFW